MSENKSKLITLLNVFKSAFRVVIIFLIIFSPSIPYFYNGTIVAFFACLSLVVTSNKNFNRFLFILRQKYILYILIAPLLIAFISLAITAFHAEFDLTIIKTLINQSFTVFVIVLSLSVFLDDDSNLLYIHKLLWIAFLIQTISLFIAFVDPSYKEIVRSLQPISFREKDGYRGGIRTLTISSSGFFGLGITYGLMYILYVKYIIDNNRYTIVNYFIYFLLIVSSFFIARTAFIGILISILMLLIYSPSFKKQIILISKITFVISVVIGALIVNNPEMFDSFFTYVVPYAFEMFISKGETTSTNTLMSMWHIPITAKEYLIGTGKYSAPNGAYYGGSDVGYIRNVLFGGITYFAVFLLHQLILLYIPLKYSFCKVIKNYTFYFILLGYILILHLKGETLGFAIAFHSLLYFYLIPIFYFNRIETNDIYED